MMLMKYRQYVRYGLIILFVFVCMYTFVSYFTIQKQSRRIFNISDPEVGNITETTSVGIVFGGGVAEDRPLALVRERLDTGRELLSRGYVDKLIVSGDNRFLNYNEPTVMKNYLVNDLGVGVEKVQEDFAGRSTYETCERATKVFGVDRAILVSESTHLPRAVYLCRHFGIEAYGVKSDGMASSGHQIGQRWREILARNKATFNANFYGEKTILGDPINIDVE